MESMESINKGTVFTNQLSAYASYKIGDWTYGTPRIWQWEFSSRLEIGKFCSIADVANIMLGGEHRVDWVTTYPFNAIFKDASGYTGHPATKGDVVIGNDVWLAREC